MDPRPDGCPEFFAPDRVASRERLISSGHNPYPYSFKRDFSVTYVLGAFKGLAESSIPLSVCGRIYSKRVMGKTIFLDLYQGVDKIQLYVRQDIVGEASFRDVCQEISVGDIVGTRGVPFYTKTKEPSIKAEKIDVLCKALVEIPCGKTDDQGRSWFRLEDVEVKRHKRYLEWLSDPPSAKVFMGRARIISWIREYMAENGFLEVDTPTIQASYGGADAQPFVTKVAALGGKTAFLRISPELHLKRYLVGGFERVYSICQNFRNEGIDSSHNPEFTMIEWYEAYADYEAQMRRVESLVSNLAQKRQGSMTIRFQDKEINLAPPWRRISIPEMARRQFGKPFKDVSKEDLLNEMSRLRVPAAFEWPRGELLMRLMERTLAEALVGPCFLVDYPRDISPLTKDKRGEDEGFVERFEAYMAGMEVANAYSELNDPVQQFQRLKAQGHQGPCQGLDLDFIHAMACGMPPAGGVGMGIDRLVMILMGVESIRDVIAFPMRQGDQ